MSYENAHALHSLQLVNLSDLTDHPSPNYLLVLQKTQEEAIKAEAGLLIVESDVTVKKDTLQKLIYAINYQIFPANTFIKN